MKTTDLENAVRAIATALLIAAAGLLGMPAFSRDPHAGAMPVEPMTRKLRADAAADAAGAPALQIDVNAASAAELERIKGIGPRIAARIVQARERGGRFRDAQDLQQRVSGIGAAKLKTMRSAGLLVPEPRAAVLPMPRIDRVELITGQPPGKRDAGRGGAIIAPAEPSRK